VANYGNFDVLFNNAGILYYDEAERQKHSAIGMANETLGVNFEGICNFTDSMFDRIRPNGKI